MKFCQPLPIQSHLILPHLILSNSIDNLIAMTDNVWSRHESFSGFAISYIQLEQTIAPKNDRVLPPFSLGDKTAIVSGASAGIGLAATQGFAEAEANVAIWYNSNGGT